MMRVITILFIGSMYCLQSTAQPVSPPKPANAVLRRLDSLKNLFSGINFICQRTPANRKYLKEVTARTAATNDLYCGYFCGGIILPVTGLQLQGMRLSETQVQLNWKTLTETNSNGFITERSFGMPDHFQRCGWQQAVGNSATRQEYKTLDANNYPGITYYRLQQQDKDGKITYSNIVAVRGYSNSATISIAPNPGTQAATQITLYGFRPNESVMLVLTDAGGKVVVKQTVLATGAQAVVALSALPPLASGFYSILASNASQKATGSCVLIP